MTWRRGTTITLEEYRRTEHPQPAPPARGTRLTELAAAIGDRPGWQNQAACRGKPTGWWYPPAGQYGPTAKQAVQICATCPVQGPCRDAGTGEPGIWGGVSGQQRRYRTRDTTTAPRNGRPLGPIPTRILDALTDGHWHTYDELAYVCADIIDTQGPPCRTPRNHRTRSDTTQPGERDRGPAPHHRRRSLIAPQSRQSRTVKRQRKTRDPLSAGITHGGTRDSVARNNERHDRLRRSRRSNGNHHCYWRSTAMDTVRGPSTLCEAEGVTP